MSEFTVVRVCCVPQLVQATRILWRRRGRAAQRQQVEKQDRRLTRLMKQRDLKETNTPENYSWHCRTTLAGRK